MRELSTVEFRDNISEAINKVSYGSDEITITRRGTPLAVLISYESYLALKAEANPLKSQR